MGAACTTTALEGNEEGPPGVKYIVVPDAKAVKDGDLLNFIDQESADRKKFMTFNSNLTTKPYTQYHSQLSDGINTSYSASSDATSMMTSTSATSSGATIPTPSSAFGAKSSTTSDVRSKSSSALSSGVSSGAGKTEVKRTVSILGRILETGIMKQKNHLKMCELRKTGVCNCRVKERHVMEETRYSVKEQPMSEEQSQALMNSIWSKLEEKFNMFKLSKSMAFKVFNETVPGAAQNKNETMLKANIEKQTLINNLKSIAPQELIKSDNSADSSNSVRNQERKLQIQKLKEMCSGVTSETMSDSSQATKKSKREIEIDRLKDMFSGKVVAKYDITVQVKGNAQKPSEPQEQIGAEPAVSQDIAIKKTREVAKASLITTKPSETSKSQTISETKEMAKSERKSSAYGEFKIDVEKLLKIVEQDDSGQEKVKLIEKHYKEVIEEVKPAQAAETKKNRASRTKSRSKSTSLKRSSVSTKVKSKISIRGSKKSKIRLEIQEKEEITVKDGKKVKEGSKSVKIIKGGSSKRRNSKISDKSEKSKNKKMSSKVIQEQDKMTRTVLEKRDDNLSLIFGEEKPSTPAAPAANSKCKNEASAKKVTITNNKTQVGDSTKTAVASKPLSNRTAVRPESGYYQSNEKKIYKSSLEDENVTSSDETLDTIKTREETARVKMTQKIKIMIKLRRKNAVNSEAYGPISISFKDNRSGDADDAPPN